MNKYTVNKIINGWLVDACITSADIDRLDMASYTVFRQVFVSSIAEISEVIDSWESHGHPGNKKGHKVVSLVKDTKNAD